MKLILAAATLALAGCAANGYQSMSPEQITALAKMKDANVNCVTINGMWGKTTIVYINLDKGVIPVGSVSTEGDCSKVSITNAPVKYVVSATYARATRSRQN